MSCKKHSVAVVMVIAVVAIALTHAFTIGYGIGFKKRYEALYTSEVAKQKQYTPLHLTVHYERKMQGKQDILRLEVDTTYRSIGKAAFMYDVICDRTVSLYESNGKQLTAAQSKECFIEGANRKWIKLSRHNSIQGYDCWEAVASNDNVTWQAWYTTQLPYCAEGATITDGLKGLILHVEETKGGYSLHAKTIDIKIG